MTQTAPTAPAPTTQSLEPLQRLQLRDQLQDLWRANVEQLTEFAVRFHSAELDQELRQDRGAIAKRLVDSRLNLAEVEAAMRRLDVGRYGACETCLDSIPFAELEAGPHRRRCATCQTDGPL